MIGGEWTGVDLDGVLALWDPDYFPNIGPPIPRMVERVRGWIADGKDVRIFTARVGVAPELQSEHGVADEGFAAEQRQRVEAWCAEHLGVVLPVTATKDFMMVELYDDRCVQMVPNTGESVMEHVDRLAAAERVLLLQAWRLDNAHA